MAKRRLTSLEYSRSFSSVRRRDIMCIALRIANFEIHKNGEYIPLWDNGISKLFRRIGDRFCWAAMPHGENPVDFPGWIGYPSRPWSRDIGYETSQVHLRIVLGYLRTSLCPRAEKPSSYVVCKKLGR
jgi:hypothetical protein